MIEITAIVQLNVVAGVCRWGTEEHGAANDVYLEEIRRERRSWLRLLVVAMIVSGQLRVRKKKMIKGSFSRWTVSEIHNPSFNFNYSCLYSFIHTHTYTPIHTQPHSKPPSQRPNFSISLDLILRPFPHRRGYILWTNRIFFYKRIVPRPFLSYPHFIPYYGRNNIT